MKKSLAATLVGLVRTLCRTGDPGTDNDFDSMSQAVIHSTRAFRVIPGRIDTRRLS